MSAKKDGLAVSLHLKLRLIFVNCDYFPLNLAHFHFDPSLLL